jgi:flagellin-specific chaperone FliS
MTPESQENIRAKEIMVLIEECHDSLTCLYEALTDRDSKTSAAEIKALQDDINKLSKFI